MKDKILTLIKSYRENLKTSIDSRMVEMESDNSDHHLIYSLLGINEEEGKLIDLYQNKGRFLYKYSGSLLEDIVMLVLQEKFPESKKTKIDNLLGGSPKKFEIDCLISNEAYEIKWKDATTDGDHIKKEHNRILNIVKHNLVPIRIMLYEPQRKQSIKVQSKLKALYHSVGGQYYSGIEAWKHIEEKTGTDLLEILNSVRLPS